MEVHTAKNDANDVLQNDSSVIQSVRKKHPKWNISNRRTDSACKSVFYDSTEPGGCITNEERKDLDSTVRYDGHEEQPTKSSDAEQHNLSQFVHSDGHRNDIPLLQSMLKKLMRPKKNASPYHGKSHGLIDESCKSGIYHSDGCATNENKMDSDSKERSDDDEDQPTKSSDTEDGIEAVEFPKWERKIFMPFPLPLRTQVAKGESVEAKKEHSMEIEPKAAQLHNNPSQPLSAPKSDLSVSSDRADFAQMETKHELLDEACGGPSNLVSMDPQFAESIPGRTARSASEPVRPKPKEERPLSAPSVLNRLEYDNFSNATTQKSLSKVAAILGWDDSDMTEHDNSFSKAQKKGVKSKVKHLTQKLMEKFKDKQDSEHTGRSGEDNVEEETESNVESEDPDIPPPLPPKKGKYVFLDRTFTLKDFKLNIEPINLMDEILKGDEWLSYLPSKTSPEEKDTSDQSIPNEVPQIEKEHQDNVLVPIPEQDQLEDTKSNQEIVNDTQAAEVNSHLPVVRVESDASVFAIPKVLLTNNAIKQMVFETNCVPKKSGDVYERVDMYIIPKKDIPIPKGKLSEILSMDFSAIKSSALLDNSALKSRIRLSKKRNHRPPKKHKKVKTEKSTAKFYKIPSVILKESPFGVCLPHHGIPFSTSPRLPTKMNPAHGPTPEDDIAPQIITDCEDLTLDFKQLGL